MPIYAYRCSACGHAQDVLQKISDPVLSVCPACGQASYAKQVTAAGFQLKGSGWYVTDFRDGNKGAKPAADKAADAPADKAADKPAEKAADSGKPAEAAAPAPAPAPPPAAPSA
jgi:putative FmdB family regulatory protein